MHQSLDFSSCRNRRLCPHARYGNRRGCCRKFKSGDQTFTFRQGNTQSPVEDIAGSRRIHGSYTPGRDTNTLRCVLQQRTHCTHRNHDILDSGTKQYISRLFGIRPTFHGNTGQQLTFRSVGSNQVQSTHQFGRKRCGRCRIEYDFRSLGRRNFCGILYRLDWHLQLHEHILCLRDTLTNRIDIPSAQRSVGA